MQGPRKPGAAQGLGFYPHLEQQLRSSVSRAVIWIYDSNFEFFSVLGPDHLVLKIFLSRCLGHLFWLESWHEDGFRECDALVCPSP